MKIPRNLRAVAFSLLGLAISGCNQLTSDTDSGEEPVISAKITNGPAGTVTDQYNNSPAAEGPANLMDGSSTTKYLTFHNTGWVQWKGTGVLGAGSYAIMSANDAPGRDPKSWSLLGSNDGIFWSTLDTRVGQVFTARYQSKSYNLASPASFLYYRLDITAAADPALNTIQFAEWDLVGAASGTTTQTLEAESATRNGPLVATKHPAYTGSGYLDFQLSNGDYVQFAFNLAAAGTGPLTFRYANGTTASIKVRVTVNGTDLATSLTMPSTGSWATWRTVNLNTPLKAGANTVRITTINIGQPNIDHLKVTSGSGTAPCTPTTVTPYVSINGSIFQQTASATATIGATVKLGPQPTTGGTWSWTGPNGFASTSREITLANIQVAQAGVYVATYTNAGGCPFNLGFSLSVSTQTPDWSTFVYPAVTFTDNAVGLEGSTIFKNAIPDAAAMMKTQILAIVKEIYSDNLDKRVTFTKLNLQLANDPNGVAWKSGNPPEITIGISAQYIANFYHNNGNNLSLVEKEVRGVLSHEGTHAYQWEPKNCGAYDGSSVFWSLIEGEADGVRAELTNWTPTRNPSKGGSWMGGYTKTGFFLSWCKRNKKPTFLIELNHAARDMATFTWDGAFQQILGIPVQQAWDEYQASLP